jgi:hypothetical protein
LAVHPIARLLLNRSDQPANRQLPLANDFLQNCQLRFHLSENAGECLLVLRPPRRLLLGIHNLQFSKQTAHSSINRRVIESDRAGFVGKVVPQLPQNVKPLLQSLRDKIHGERKRDACRERRQGRIPVEKRINDVFDGGFVQAESRPEQHLQPVSQDSSTEDQATTIRFIGQHLLDDGNSMFHFRVDCRQDIIEWVLPGRRWVLFHDRLGNRKVLLAFGRWLLGRHASPLLVKTISILWRLQRTGRPLPACCSMRRTEKPWRALT